MVNRINHKIEKVTDVKKSDNEIVFECRSDGRESLKLLMTFYAPDVFRVRMDPIPAANREETPIDLVEDVDFGPVSPKLIERDDEIEVKTDKLTVLVDLDPWSLEIKDKDGRRILAEDNSPVHWEGYHPSGLGYTLKQSDVSRHRGDMGWHSVESVHENFKLNAEEHVFGLGEKFTDFDKRGQEIETWIMDPPLLGSEGAYKNIPFFMSTRGFGVFVNSTCRMTHKIGSETTGRYFLEVEDDFLDWYFIYGPSFKRILDIYTDLTGKPPVPPKWSFGLWMSRSTYEDRKELMEVCERLREEEVPCDVVHLDPSWMRDEHNTDLKWDEDDFPEPEEMIENLHDMGFKLCLWEHPYVPEDTAAFDEAMDKDYFIRMDGSTYINPPGEFNPRPQGFVDFTNPDAVEWWKDKHRKLLDMGVDVFKTDFGEAIPEEAQFYNGLTGRRMHNYYPLLYNKTVFEVVEEKRGTGLVWGRSAYAGSQKYPVHWGGDPRESFRDMANTLRGGLGYGMSGFAFWSHDIGGFTGEPDPELYIRWAQLGLLWSHSRCHGTTPREPWEFGDEALSIFKKYANLRYRLIPYLFSYANIASKTGIPVLRPMVLEYQDDPITHTMDTQYMLGRELLVTPVLTREGKKNVYLPEGTWYDFWTGEKFEGPKNLNLTVDLDEVPIFVKSDSIVPLGPKRQYLDELEEEITLNVYLESYTEFELFREENNPIRIICKDTSDGLSIETDETDVEMKFRVHDVDLPEKVTVNGKGLNDSEWIYDEEEKIVELQI